LLSFWNPNTGSAQGPYVDPSYEVRARLWMRMPGGRDHGGRGTVHASSYLDSSGMQQVGQYEISRLHFTMRGRWEIHIELWNSNGRVEDVVQEIQI
jgi:hypothetical protein